MISGSLTRFSNKKERKPAVSAVKVGSLKSQRKKIGDSRKPKTFTDATSVVLPRVAKPKKATQPSTM